MRLLSHAEKIHTWLRAFNGETVDGRFVRKFEDRRFDNSHSSEGIFLGAEPEQWTEKSHPHGNGTLTQDGNCKQQYTYRYPRWSKQWAARLCLSCSTTDVARKRLFVFRNQAGVQLLFKAKVSDSKKNLSTSHLRVTDWKPICLNHLFSHSFFSNWVVNWNQTLNWETTRLVFESSVYWTSSGKMAPVRPLCKPRVMEIRRLSHHILVQIYFAE